MPDRAKPAYQISRRRVELERLPVGGSRFGGSPDLPESLEWPHHRERPITFLAQIELSRLASSELPASGWLLFFYDVAEQPWGFDPLHRGAARVLHVDVPRDQLVRRPHPDVLSAGGPFECCELILSECSERAAIEPRHQLLGEPASLMAAPFGMCELASSGIFCGDPSGFERPGAAERLAAARDQWQLLLELDSDLDGPEFSWEDGGCIDFCIRRSDLADRAFERTWLVLQTRLL